MTVTRDTEIRKLPTLERYGLVKLLDSCNAWKQIICRVKRIPTNALPCVYKYTTEHVNMIESAGETQKRSCAEIFLEEWECSGQKRPTLADILSLFIEARLYRAADYVAVDILKESAPSRPQEGSAAPVPDPWELSPLRAPPQSNTDFEVNAHPPLCVGNEFVRGSTHHTSQRSAPGDILGNNEESASTLAAQQQETIPVEEIGTTHIAFRDLEILTNNFDENPLGVNGGRLLGKGAFGSVYLAVEGNQFTAVKRLNRAVDVDKLFRNELATLFRLEHSNLLRLVAYSRDGPENCLVYEYMSEGNLEERLSCQGRWKIPLPHLTRIRIALGACQGLRHLHEHHKPPLVHRDVKSANILLDSDLNAKLGDFGLVRCESSVDGNSSGQLSSSLCGTSVYMAPEAFKGEISLKSDVFSIGVVFLELLTALSPYNADGDDNDLVTYVSEMCEETIEPILDGKAGNWLSNSGQKLSDPLFALTQGCLEDKDKRPSIGSVVERLQSILNL